MCSSSRAFDVDTKKSDGNMEKHETSKIFKKKPRSYNNASIRSSFLSKVLNNSEEIPRNHFFCHFEL